MCEKVDTYLRKAHILVVKELLSHHNLVLVSKSTIPLVSELGFSTLEGIATSQLYIETFPILAMSLSNSPIFC